MNNSANLLKVLQKSIPSLGAIFLFLFTCASNADSLMYVPAHAWNSLYSTPEAAAQIDAVGDFVVNGRCGLEVDNSTKFWFNVSYLDGRPGGCVYAVYAYCVPPDSTSWPSTMAYPPSGLPSGWYPDGGNLRCNCPTGQVWQTDANQCNSYFVSVQLLFKPQCNSCNVQVPIPDPINAATGATFDTLTDVASGTASFSFNRYYNSSDVDNTTADISNGWRHSYSRNVVVRNSTGEVHQYVQAPDYSSQYADPATACNSGFPEIQSRVPQWSGASVSYANGNCTLTKNGAYVGTLTVYSTGGAPVSAPQPVAYDVVRDDGQLIRFVVNVDGTVAAPPGIGLRLQQTQSGFTITDTNDDVEQYDASGKLLTVTSRGGVVQTMSYDSSGRLSNVTDSFGHQLTFTYDAQGHLSSVVRQ